MSNIIAQRWGSGRKEAGSISRACLRDLELRRSRPGIVAEASNEAEAWPLEAREGVAGSVRTEAGEGRGWRSPTGKDIGQRADHVR